MVPSFCSRVYQALVGLRPGARDLAAELPGWLRKDPPEVQDIDPVDARSGDVAGGEVHRAG